MRAGWPRRAARDSYRRISRVSSLSRAVRADSALGCHCRCCRRAATRPRLRRLGNQVEPRASRAGYGARRRVGTRGRRAREGEEEREKTYTKAAIFRKGNQRRAFRAAYHRATPPLLRPSIPQLRRRRPPYRFALVSPASVRSLHRGLFPQPVASMDLTDEK